jgi:hypothetical protein
VCRNVTCLDVSVTYALLVLLFYTGSMSIRLFD